MLFPSEIPPSFLFSKIKTGNPIDKNWKPNICAPILRRCSHFPFDKNQQNVKSFMCFPNTQFSRWERKTRTFSFYCTMMFLSGDSTHPVRMGMSRLSLHKTVSVFSNFLEKKHDAMKGFVWRSRSDTRLYIYSCVFVFFLVCLKVIFSFPKKKGKQKTEGNCAPYGGLERKCTGNPPLRISPR